MNPVYAYIYDDFLSDRRYENLLASLETRLASLGLSGRIGRLALFRSAQELVQDFVDQGAKNIIIVGNDDTLNKVMWFLPDLNVVVGYIPLTQPADIANLLSIPKGLPACEAIGARLIEQLDMGKLGDRYFLTEAVFEQSTAKLEVHGSFSLSLIRGGTIRVCNLGGILEAGQSLADAKDGYLEVRMIPHHDMDIKSRIWNRLGMQSPAETSMYFKSGTIISTQPIEVHADRFAMSGFRFPVQIVPRKLKIITGRMHRVIK